MDKAVKEAQAALDQEMLGAAPKPTSTRRPRQQIPSDVFSRLNLDDDMASL